MDNVEITVTAGRGGGGVISFWREKFHPLGGPDGGDGGKGGDIYIEASSNEQDLSGFRNKKSYRAENGKNGDKQKKHGRDGEDLYVYVPVGTTVYKKDGGSRLLVADLRKDREKALVASGGRGGLGNVHFASSIKKAPREATDGKAGEVVKLILEYRVVADVCLIGLPNSGKSLLLSRMTTTSPRIAEYPFTTVEPVMGKVTVGFDSFTLVEVPALIDGANQGRGLGNRFLKHCQRSRIILFVLDGSTKSLADDLALLKKELEMFDKGLLKKQVLAVVNKIDMEEVSARKAEIEKSLGKTGIKVFFTSAKTGDGVELITRAVHELLKQAPSEDEPQEAPEFVFRPKPVTRRKK